MGVIGQFYQEVITERNLNAQSIQTVKLRFNAPLPFAKCELVVHQHLHMLLVGIVSKHLAIFHKTRSDDK